MNIFYALLVPAAASAALLMLAIMAAIALHNLRAFPHLAAPIQRTDTPDAFPAVSLLIPARNEAATIAHAIGDLLAQDYPSFELIVLDDHSEDGTAALARQAMASDPRARLLSGAPLPPGWLGKHWACHQLAQAASSDLLLFADADVRWRSDALRAIVAHRQATSAALLTVWPQQQTVTWAERLVVPLMPFILHAYLPVAWAHDPTKVTAAAANGQCMLFARAAYTQIGGHSAVRHYVLDDVSLARAVKRNYLPLRMVAGGAYLTCRMYRGWHAVRQGFSKNILAAHGNAPALLIVSVLLHLLIFVLPVIWLLAALWLGVWTAALIAGLILLIGIAVRGLTAATADLRLGDALYMPLSVLLFAAVAANALWQHWRHGGPRWKDRHIPAGRGAPNGY